MIVGIDEVGRGCLAGPLCMAAVVLGDTPIPGLTDSKKLTKKRREVYSAQIKKSATAIGIGWASAREIDAKGMSRCLELCASRAISQMHVPYTQIIIDGTVRFIDDKRVVTMKQADLIVPSVSAASIIAKVARDSYMDSMAEVFDGYGFASHVGYGTAMHLSALNDKGPTPIHRYSFAPLAPQTPRAPKRHITSSGIDAEAVAAEYLLARGYRIMERNWKTKWCEIDIIASKDETIYFVEVKYRKTDRQGAGLEYITNAKQRQMRFAAELWSHRYRSDTDLCLSAIEVSGEPMNVSLMIDRV